MPKYNWEAKPPITRSDLFANGIEVGEVHASDDERAIAWLEKMFKRYDDGSKLTMKISLGNRMVRTLKSGGKS